MLGVGPERRQPLDDGGLRQPDGERRLPLTARQRAEAAAATPAPATERTTLLPEVPTGPVFVSNGDLVTTLDYATLFAYHWRHGGAITIAGVEHRTRSRAKTVMLMMSAAGVTPTGSE